MSLSKYSLEGKGITNKLLVINCMAVHQNKWELGLALVEERHLNHIDEMTVMILYVIFSK